MNRAYSNQCNNYNSICTLGIIGYGSWGLALAQRYAKSFEKVILCGRSTEKLQQKVRELPIDVQQKIDSCNNWSQLATSHMIMIATPSHAFKEVSSSLLLILKNKEATPIILLACKGLVEEAGHIKFLHQSIEEDINIYFRDTQKKPLVGALSGPSFAKEVALGLPCALTLSYAETQFTSILTREDIKQDFKIAQQMLHQNQMRIYLTTDIIGCQVGGAFKNVIALASGVVHGLELGLNAQAALITRGLSEMIRLGCALGAQAQTMQGLAGLGDLMLTATGYLSRNRMMGELLAQNYSTEQALQKVGQVVESIYATRLFYKVKLKFNLDLPILENVHAILFENLPCTQALQNLIQRQAKEED